MGWKRKQKRGIILEDLLSSIALLIFMGAMLFIGIYGVINFNGFMKKYISFMDSRNTTNINYPKGDYSRTVMKATIGMCLVMGASGVILLLLNMFGIISAD